MIRTALSPGKLILSGEHAVVQGCPALVMAVNPEAQVTRFPVSGPSLKIQLPDRKAVHFNLKDLPGHLQAVREAHQKEAAISPEDLLVACAALTSPPSGASLTFTSEIPLGSGLGSSAAFILALLKVLQPNASREQLYSWAVEGESFQHGTSSGLDVMASLGGGIQKFHSGESRQLADLHLPQFQVYHSGRPESSTGHCVAQSQSVFAGNPKLIEKFTTITEAFISALKISDMDALHHAVRDNHRYLCELGVVPAAIQESILQLEKTGCSAKICGAGSVNGQTAGMVMVLGNANASVPAHWKPQPITCTRLGTRIT